MLKNSVHLPKATVTVLLGEVDFLRGERDFFLDVNNWPWSGRTKTQWASQWTLWATRDQINTSVDSLEHKDRVGEGSDSQVGVEVLIQVHVACQRVAEQPYTYSLARQHLQQEKHIFVCENKV